MGARGWPARLWSAVRVRLGVLHERLGERSRTRPPVGKRWIAGAAVGLAGLPSLLRLVGDGDRAFAIMIVSFVPQAAVVLVVLGVALIALRHWRSAAAAGLLVALNVAWLVPLYVSEDPPEDGTDIVAMTLNLQYGWADPDRVVEAVREHEVDVLALTELTPAAVTALVAAGLEDTLAHRELTPAPEAHGSGLWSRYPLTAQPGWPGVHLQPGARLRLTDADGRPREVHVQVVHPYRTGRFSAASYRRDHRELRQRMAALPAHLPALVLGDFNATRDHEAFRRLLGDGWRDAPEYAGSGFLGTWSPRYWMPHFLQLDHILFNGHFGARSASAFEVPGSDHAALRADLVLAPAGAPPAAQ